MTSTKTPLKILTVLGARPQFVKAAPVTHALREAGLQETIIHTGQHYDRSMSEVFFQELDIPTPHINLEVGSGPHGAMTGLIMTRLEPIVSERRPDWVVVYGDTNSTLAAALVACKLRIRLAHVEAGLRSFNREMPEEHNRVITDHVADLLCCPTPTAVANLEREGLRCGVHMTGDTMVDSLFYARRRAAESSCILKELGLTHRGFVVATLHRPYLTDDADNLEHVMGALGELEDIVVFPCHPRTRVALQRNSIVLNSNIRVFEPLGYFEMVRLVEAARIVVTDSGGLQKEAFILGVPCVTVRPETEWVETVDAGWNVVIGHDPQRLVAAAKKTDWPMPPAPSIYGDGHAATRIVALLANAW